MAGYDDYGYGYENAAPQLHTVRPAPPAHVCCGARRASARGGSLSCRAGRAGGVRWKYASRAERHRPRKPTQNAFMSRMEHDIAKRDSDKRVNEMKKTAEGRRVLKQLGMLPPPSKAVSVGKIGGVGCA